MNILKCKITKKFRNPSLRLDCGIFFLRSCHSYLIAKHIVLSTDKMDSLDNNIRN